MAVLSLTVLRDLTTRATLSSVPYSQRAHPRHELLEKLIGVHEHCKVPATADRHERFARRFNGFQVLLSQRRWSCKILLTLKNKYGNGEFQAKVCRSDGLGLRDEAIGAQHLALRRVIYILHRIAGSHEREADGPIQKLICALKGIRPLVLHAIAIAGFVRRGTYMAQFLDGALIPYGFGLLQ